MFDDLVSMRQPPANRVGFHKGDAEHHLTEGAVMVAFALHLFRTLPDLRQVDIHPDGEHGKIFDFAGWLGRQGFGKTSSTGTTSYGGLYADLHGRTILLNPKSGRLDVVARIGDSSFVAETKGGVINTRHSGKTSQLRKGLCEAVGMLMQIPVCQGQRQFAVVPLTPVTEELASGPNLTFESRASGLFGPQTKASGANLTGRFRQIRTTRKMRPRTKAAGIDVALVDGRGNVFDVT